MKKRKSPILLITLLVVCVAVVIGMNLPQSSPDKPGEQPQANAEAQPGAPRQNSPSVADLQKRAKESMKGGPPNPMARAKKLGMPEDAIPASIENPVAKAYKPKPNDSSISTQWYTDETRK